MVFEKIPIAIVVRRPSLSTVTSFANEGYIEPYYSIKFVGKPIILRVIEGAKRTVEFLGGHYVYEIFIESEGDSNEIQYRERQLAIYLRNKFSSIPINIIPKILSQSELGKYSLQRSMEQLVMPLVIRGDEYIVSRLSRLNVRESSGVLSPVIDADNEDVILSASYLLTSPAKLRHASIWCAKDLSPADLMFDLDGTLRTFQNKVDGGEPIQDAISVLKIAYDSGHRIIIKTARGFKDGKRPGYFAARRILKQVKRDLADLGVPYHEIIYCVNYADVYVDDFSVNPTYYSIDKATGFYFRE